ncbi:MAG: response regulator transcription factor [Ignavibacteria bacterium]|jgi:DNA-binding NarL/FixJ family response regulator
MKFLIVDDNEDFRSYIRESIETKDDNCVELDDGLNVNSVYREFKPDWVLLDIMMKKVDGLTAAKRLKEEFPEARFAIVSDFSDKLFREAAIKLGASAFIPKENIFYLTEIIHRK